ncbi:MAG TPA: polysaccharide lyase family 7 protein [Pseudonocardia sp.]|nr:polysaccharide lyase family 7 protein [Pseudonocardia sp.]
MSGVLAGALAVIVIVLPGPPGADGNQQAPGSADSATPWVSPPDAATPYSATPYSAAPYSAAPYSAAPDAGGGAGQPDLGQAAGSAGGSAAGSAAGSALPRLGQAVGGVANGVGNGLANGVNGVARAVDLSGWKLTLPKASEKGTAASINPADSAPPWLTRDDTGCLKFWAPVDGATTPNSQHPRTELVSLNNFKAGSGQHVLRASLAVAQAPSTNRDIIIGQIHGADDISSVPFVMLHYDGGTIKVVVKQAQSGSTSDKYPLITGVPLGARFDYAISDNGDGKLTFAARYGSQTPHVTVPIPAPFQGATVRFQAGAYQQGEAGGGGSDDGARVNFFTLDEGPDGRSAAP